MLCAEIVSSFLLCMYAVEGLCQTGRSADAAVLLEPKYMLLPPTAASLYKPTASAPSTESIKGEVSVSVAGAAMWVTDDVVVDICAGSVGDTSTAINGGDENVTKSRIVEAVVLTNRAVVLCVQGELSRAQDILQSVVASFPSFAPAVRNLVYVSMRRRDHSEAIRVLQKHCTQATQV